MRECDKRKKVFSIRTTNHQMVGEDSSFHVSWVSNFSLFYIIILQLIEGEAAPSHDFVDTLVPMSVNSDV
jgi:hypothetical protein